MNSQAVFLYLLKTMLISGVLLGYYWLALRNKKFHAYNRFYLLFTLLLSISIPFLNFSWISIEAPVYFGANEGLNYLITANTTTIKPGSSWQDWVLTFSAAVAIILIVVQLIHINAIYRLKRTSVVTKMGDIDFVNTDAEDAPFSYLKNLFWKKSISTEAEEGRKILKHELTHIRQKHTLDRLFAQALCAIMWLNPFFWIIQKELLTIHEFIADEEAIADHDAESFARMLLLTHYGSHFLHPQSFFYSSIKRRLIMLTTSKNTRFSYARRLIALPVLAFIIVAFSLEVNAGTETKTLNGSSVSNTASVKNQLPAQETPKFPGGAAGWQQFLRTTCNFDKIVEKGGPPGTYKVQLSFVVDKQGDVRDVKALNDPGYGAKEDAMRVLLSSPKWTPATLNGKKVVYRDKITITYQVSED